MAVTSLWAVKGWLGKVVLYVEDPEKTSAPKCYEERGSATQDLDDVIRYAIDQEKTTLPEEIPYRQRLVSGVNCNPATARQEMLAVKRRFGKEDGVVAYHYCYLLGIFPRNKRRLPRRVPPALREELLRGERFSQEVRLLSRYKIDTVEQLEGRRGKVEEKLDSLISQRAALYRQIRTVAVQSDPERKDRVKQEISTLTGQIKNLRKEVALCQDIAQRSGKMRENLRMAREEKENSSPKREEQHRSR